MRLALCISRTDRKSINDLCEQTGIPSFNQLAVETTLLECWKTLNYSLPSSDLCLLPHIPLRSLAGGMFNIPATKHQENFVWKATHLWNRASPEIHYIEKPKSAKDFISSFASAHRLESL